MKLLHVVLCRARAFSEPGMTSHRHRLRFCLQPGPATTSPRHHLPFACYKCSATRLQEALVWCDSYKWVPDCSLWARYKGGGSSILRIGIVQYANSKPVSAMARFLKRVHLYRNAPPFPLHVDRFAGFYYGGVQRTFMWRAASTSCRLTLALPSPSGDLSLSRICLSRQTMPYKGIPNNKQG